MQPLVCNCYQETLSVANSQPPSGPLRQRVQIKAFLPGLSSLPASGPVDELGSPRTG